METNPPTLHPLPRLTAAPRPKLFPDNLDLLRTVLKYRLITTEQVHRAVRVPRAEAGEAVGTTQAMAITLKRLYLKGFLGRDWVDPKKHLRDTPASAVWFMEKQHFGKLCDHLAETARADLCEDLTTAHVFRDGSSFAANTPRHELAITDFYLALDPRAIAFDFCIYRKINHLAYQCERFLISNPL